MAALLNLIYCELLKLKHSKMVLISVLGVMSTPFMMLIEALQIHFEYPERVFTLDDIYDSSLWYMMLLTNMIIYVVIAAYLFSREYTESTLKTILPIPVSRIKLLLSSMLMFVMASPFAYVAQKTKGFVAPVIASAVIAMGSAAICNQDFGALYPWTAAYFLIKGKMQSTGYPVSLGIGIIVFVSAMGFWMTLKQFREEDLK